MKKITLVALLCALFMVPSVKAQEVTYVEDPSQGVLLNKFQDNWFIQGEAGMGMLFSTYDSKLDFGKRLTPTFNLAVGKWFSPIIGMRVGLQMYKEKGVTTLDGIGIRDAKVIDGMYLEQKVWEAGPAVDVLINVTNWWCGYRPGRVYNAVVYGGASGKWIWTKNANGNFANSGQGLGVQLGLMNTFAVSPQVDLMLDIRANMDQNHIDGYVSRKYSGYGQVLAGITYKFKKREWSAPIVPVCPEYKYTDAEGDALVARLQAANAKIASLEQELKACLNRPQPVAEKCEMPLATIYFPIGVSRLTAENNRIIKSAANAMVEMGGKYVVTGYADSYTGSESINNKLREARANNVAKVLKKNGVAEESLTITTDNNNLTNYGEKSAPMDRAATITIAK